MFFEELRESIARKGTRLCVGLDPQEAGLPGPLVGRLDTVYALARHMLGVVEATAPHAAAFKPNLAFFDRWGGPGADALSLVVSEAGRLGVPVIGDGKRGDVGHTAAVYAAGLFDGYGFGAVTVNPYLGPDSVEPFLEHRGCGVYLLCRTSNTEARVVQDYGDPPLYEVIAGMAHSMNLGTGDVRVGLVVGATSPAELVRIAGLVPGLPLLVPGLGAQGGDTDAFNRVAAEGCGVPHVANVSRAISTAGVGYQGDFREAVGQAARYWAERLPA